MVQTSSITVASFYRFFPVADTAVLEQRLESWGAEYGLKGLVIIASEGLNATVSGEAQNLKTFIARLETELGFTEPLFAKYSEAPKIPFRLFKVKIRSEIVTTARPDLSPLNFQTEKNTHLSPSQWNEVLKNDKDVFLVDTRNWYETKIGTFQGAVDPKIEEFTDFPKFMREQNLPKDKKVLMFCTGGIRCEKGILEMQADGFENVYQLEGGILNYLQQFPNDLFEGECFVFDHRVAVQQNLEPTERYSLCPHCGQPATVTVACRRCDHESQICESCAQKTDDVAALTCSKNCAHHWTLRPGKKGPRQTPTYKVE
jgi:UPF0176 protein